MKLITRLDAKTEVSLNLPSIHPTVPCFSVGQSLTNQSSVSSCVARPDRSASSGLSGRRFGSPPLPRRQRCATEAPPGRRTTARRVAAGERRRLAAASGTSPAAEPALSANGGGGLPTCYWSVAATGPSSRRPELVDKVVSNPSWPIHSRISSLPYH